jgi:hypothetical protein
VPVLINALTGQSHEGYLVFADDLLKQNSFAESENVEKVAEAEEGHPRGVRHAPVPFEGLEMWYEH